MVQWHLSSNKLSKVLFTQSSRNAAIPVFTRWTLINAQTSSDLTFHDSQQQLKFKEPVFREVITNMSLVGSASHIYQLTVNSWSVTFQSWQECQSGIHDYWFLFREMLKRPFELLNQNFGPTGSHLGFSWAEYGASLLSILLKRKRTTGCGSQFIYLTGHWSTLQHADLQKTCQWQYIPGLYGQGWQDELNLLLLCFKVPILHLTWKRIDVDDSILLGLAINDDVNADQTHVHGPTDGSPKLL